MSIFQSVVKAEQWYGGPRKSHPLVENENPASISNQEQRLELSTKRQKVVQDQPISVGIESWVELCGFKYIEKGFICTGKKVYRPPLTSTYKETKIL